MRTLFLVGILATLVVIALKQPDQTALQAASQWAERLQVIAEETPAVNTRLPVERIVTAEPSAKPVAVLPKPTPPRPRYSGDPSPAITEQNQKPNTEDPRPQKMDPPVEVRTPKIPEVPKEVPETSGSSKIAEAIETKPEIVKPEAVAVKPRSQPKPPTALPELAEVEVKSVPVHFPKEGPLDGGVQPSAPPTPDYGVIQRRYRNTIAILGKIQ